MIFFRDYYKNKNRFFTTLGLLILFLPFMKTCASKEKSASEIIAKTSIKKPIDSLNTAIYIRDTINDSIYYFKTFPVKKERKIKLFDESFISGYYLVADSVVSNYEIIKSLWNNKKIDRSFYFFIFFSISLSLFSISVILFGIGLVQTFIFPQKLYFSKYLIVEILLILFYISMIYLIGNEKTFYEKFLYGFWLFLINNSILVYYNYKAYKNLKSD
jgi:hypothetical protein